MLFVVGFDSVKLLWVPGLLLLSVTRFPAEPFTVHKPIVPRLAPSLIVKGADLIEAISLKLVLLSVVVPPKTNAFVAVSANVNLL